MAATKLSGLVLTYGPTNLAICLWTLLIQIMPSASIAAQRSAEYVANDIKGVRASITRLSARNWGNIDAQSIVIPSDLFPGDRLFIRDMVVKLKLCGGEPIKKGNLNREEYYDVPDCFDIDESVPGTPAENTRGFAGLSTPFDSIMEFLPRLSDPLVAVNKPALSSSNPDYQSGDSLKIAIGPGRFYRIRAGDTLVGVANSYGVAVDAIKQINHKSETSNWEPTTDSLIRIPLVDGYKMDWPLVGTFAPNVRPDEGITFPYSKGAAVWAAGFGKVVGVWRREDYYQVVIDHENGFKTVYDGLDLPIVSGNTLVGGDTLLGKASQRGVTFTVYQNDTPIDPARVLSREDN